jgi:hypothetical protein
MTPAVAAQRAKWLIRYRSTKLIAEGVLEPLGKLHLLPEVFDDLAEAQRAPDVSNTESVPDAPEAAPQPGSADKPA